MADTEQMRTIGRVTEALRSDCLRLLAHDLNNPLTAIRILAEMLRDEVSDPEVRQDVIDILEAADLAGALMDGMSSMVRLEGGHEDYTWFPIDLVEMLRGVVDRPALRRHVKLDVPREIQMGGDRAALARAFTDLFMNGRRLVEGQNVVTVRASDEGSDVVVVLHHPGHGVPSTLRPRLLELFGAVELRQNRIPVSAVGLVYARSVIEAHGGNITLVDAEDQGMDAVIRLRR